MANEAVRIQGVLTAIDDRIRYIKAPKIWSFIVEVFLPCGRSPRSHTPFLEPRPQMAYGGAFNAPRREFQALHQTFVVGADYEFTKELGQGVLEILFMEEAG